MCGAGPADPALSHSMDKDGTLVINFGEWRDYLLFHPSSELHDILQYWRHSTVCF